MNVNEVIANRAHVLNGGFNEGNTTLKQTMLINLNLYCTFPNQEYTLHIR